MPGRHALGALMSFVLPQACEAVTVTLSPFLDEETGAQGE